LKRVLVTGATSGLGRETAVQLGRRGWKIAITGRRADKLDATAKAVREAGGEALPLVGSVADPEEVRRHYDAIRAAWDGLDWAILNAGVGDSENGLDFSAENVRWTFETNVFGAANWIEAVLPGMLAQQSGTIAGVGSLAGFRGLPASGAYSSSKAALHTMLESLRLDLKGSGVRVVIVAPGFVKSELTGRNEAKMPFLLETGDGVRRMIRGIEAGKRVVHFPWQLSLVVIYVLGLMPNWLYDAATTLFPKRKKKPDPNRPKTRP
jgi:short-subunit dehydrogenase